MPSRTLRVDVADRSYDIEIGSGTLDDPATYSSLPGGSRSVIVTNDVLNTILASRLKKALEADGRRVETIVLRDGEEHKVWPSVERIIDAMLAMHCDRETVVYALGGGVVGDTAGFAAACYMRGVRYVQVPTSLLAQVDSSVGGKTGINHAAGKNLIGAFHQPSRVLIDIDVLATLPNRQLVAGLAEVIKYGMACDEEFLGWIESNIVQLLSRDKSALLEAVGRSCEIKSRVVAADERESGPRAVLNFGHTFAHAIETATEYGSWLHGEAVACGMVLATDLSARLGLVSPALVERVLRIVQAAGLPTRAPAFGVEHYLELMRLDKKSQGGELRFVLLRGPGRASVSAVDTGLVAQAIEARMAMAPDSHTVN